MAVRDPQLRSTCVSGGTPRHARGNFGAIGIMILARSHNPERFRNCHRVRRMLSSKSGLGTRRVPEPPLYLFLSPRLIFHRPRAHLHLDLPPQCACPLHGHLPLRGRTDAHSPATPTSAQRSAQSPRARLPRFIANDRTRPLPLSKRMLGSRPCCLGSRVMRLRASPRRSSPKVSGFVPVSSGC